MSKNVAVFVDVANIFYAAKAAGVDIDYVTLLKAASAGRDLVRAYAYTGLDPDNENQRNFHDFLRRHGYKVVSKDIRKYGDGKVKANLDIELVVDMMKTARNLDIAIVVSGDGDFAPAIRAVQEQGVRVEVISFRGNTSSDLIEVADLFTDIVALARVEKGSRSGRRVSDDETDLSMTEVPDKQTEGTGAGRGRSRTRGRGREAEPVAAAGRGRGRTRATSATAPAAAVAASDGAGGLVAMPGERLSRAGAALSEAEMAKAEVFTLDDLEAESETAPVEAAEPANGEVGEGGEPRRRRRRGGRGRGRGRGRGEGELAEASTETGSTQGARLPADMDEDLEEEEDEIAPPPRAARPSAFGSVWDSQLGTAAAASRAPLGPLPDEEDLEEPEIPEYLIAEQRRGGRGGGGRGARGGRSAYQSAMERERYGRGGGGGGINRYPDVSGRGRGTPPPRDERTYGRGDRDRGSGRPSTPPAPRASSNEPWSDVPPELEAMLRAQVAQKPVTGRPAPATPVSGRATEHPVEQEPARERETAEPAARPAEADMALGAAEAETPAVGEAAPAVATRGRATRKPTTGRTSRTRTPAGSGEAPETAIAPATGRTASGEPEGAATAAAAGQADEVAKPAPKPRTRRTATSKATAPTTEAAATEAAATRAAASEAAASEAVAPARKPRATRKPAAKAASTQEAASQPAEGDTPAAPKRRTRKAVTAEGA